jgi:glycosyltransferase involved in cell wall biosynthesis
MSAKPGRVAFVLKGYPRLSETFIANEIAALEARGLRILIVSLRHPTDRQRHPVHSQIAAEIHYLPEYLHDEPARVARAVLAGLARPGLWRLLGVWLRDLWRDRSRNRLRRLGQALVLARKLPGDVTWLHAHFLHTPASVARYTAILTGLPWSASAHARDIWTSPDWEKAEKLAACRWAVTCTKANLDHLATLAPPGRVALVYHGLPLGAFPPPAAGRAAAKPLIILSVGRLVAKKGYDLLLAALARLPAALDWRFVHLGGGPLKDEMRRQMESLGLSERIDWRGAADQTEVLRHYRQSDLFVLASRIDGDGDRDGLPNVLMEAQSQGLACISTRLSAIPELILEGETGLLVEPGDIDGLAAAIAALLADPVRRATLGQAGMTRVRALFSQEAGLNLLAARFGVG